MDAWESMPPGRRVPRADAPPEATMARCACGAGLLTQVWHNRTATEEAYWAVGDVPRTAALGLPHRCEQDGGRDG
jgi:hypothetical protein